MPHRCAAALLRVGAARRARVAFDGGLADRVRVPAECLVPLPDGLPLADASLVEPLAVCWHALRRVSAAPGERVLVVGGGSVGLLAVAAARALGLEVDLEARHPHQKAAGERLGAGAPDGEYDVVIEAAGTESPLASCIEHAVPGGRIAVVGVHQGALPLAGVPFMVKELTVAASLCYDCGRDGHESRKPPPCWPPTLTSPPPSSHTASRWPTRPKPSGRRRPGGRRDQRFPPTAVS